MGQTPDAPADLAAIGHYLNIEILPADELLPRKRLVELDRLQRGAFSAATIPHPDGRLFAVYNPLSDRGRTNSDLAHEFAHQLLDHDVRQMQVVVGFTFLTCDREQEEEANWLAGCLLLPRPLLLREALAGAGPEQLAEKYELSVPMARFRLNTSGVLLQVRRRRGSSPRGGAGGPDLDEQNP